MDTSMDQMPTRGLGARRSWLTPSALLLLLVIVFGAFWFYQKNNQSPSTFGLSKTTYHAVFLTNEQVYFGKINRMSDQFVTIDNVYYLRKLETPLQPIADNKNTTTSDTNTPDLQIVKLGGEVHAPQNQMTINRDQIIYIEELKPDSQIVKTIEKSKNK